MRSAELREMCSHSKFSLKLDNKGGKTGRLSMAGAYCRHKKNAKGVYIHMHIAEDHLSTWLSIMLVITVCTEAIHILI